MRLLCLNQFAPPDPAPTAKLLGDLGDALVSLGWEVSFVSGAGGYRKGKGAGWKRWARELAAHARMFARGCLARRPDVILCLTDPPCLPFTAMVLARLRGVPLAHWAMDVYPEIAAALGEVRREGLLFRIVKRAMRTAYDDCALIACLDQDMVVAMGLQGDPRVMICPPWPSRGLPVAGTPGPAPHTAPERFRWLYSGNLGRAHDYETLLQAQRLLEEAGRPFDLIFQGGGPCREAAKQRAEELGLRHCRWLDYAAEQDLTSSLLDADVLVATQKTETKGLLWPSKLSLLRLLPRPVAWIGPPDGEVARSLRQDGSRTHGTFAPGDSRGLASWLQAQAATHRKVPDAADQMQELKIRLERAPQDGVKDWHRRLQSLVASRP